MRAEEVLALIPARSGSKGIPNKNILSFRGKPLLAHAIEHGRASRRVTRVIVSTDSPEYAEIARRYGAEVPFLRPAAISGDAATDLEVFQHALTWLDETEGYRPDACAHLRPTHPNRSASDVDRAVGLLEQEPEVDSVRSVVPAPFTPFKMWFLDTGGLLTPCQGGIPEAFNLPRQVLPAAYAQAASIDVAWAAVIRNGSMTGSRIRALVLDEMADIDTVEDWRRAELAGDLNPVGRRFVIDIDGVVANLVPGGSYAEATPIEENIQVIRQLVALGNEVVLFTARGSVTGIDWRDLTRTQLEDWGVPYSELRHGKPAADYYVDDRMVSIAEIKRALRRGFEAATGKGDGDGLEEKQR